MRTVLHVWRASTEAGSWPIYRPIVVPEPYQAGDSVQLGTSEMWRWPGYNKWPNLYHGYPAADWRLGLR